MKEIKLGKIEIVSFGYCRYQEAMFGVYFDITGKSWGVSDFWGTWAHNPDKHCKWTLADQSKIFADTTRKIKKLLDAAGKTELSQLKGVPVEVTFNAQSLESWRVLTEVI